MVIVLLFKERIYEYVIRQRVGHANSIQKNRQKSAEQKPELSFIVRKAQV